MFRRTGDGAQVVLVVVLVVSVAEAVPGLSRRLLRQAAALRFTTALARAG